MKPEVVNVKIWFGLKGILEVTRPWDEGLDCCWVMRYSPEAILAGQDDFVVASDGSKGRTWT